MIVINLKKKLHRYVLLTAARNEENYINRTLNSVIAQVIKPQKWIIISDGSTDMTDEIVSKYAHQYSFIKLTRFKRKINSAERNFGAKADAINYGYKYLNDIEYDFLGNLDADVSFEPNYYKTMLDRFQINANLGIAGGVVCHSHREKIRKHKHYLNSVSGSVQLFRRCCYEDIGGYKPINTGGIDTVAEVSARMCGWETQTFTDIEVIHHRRPGSEGKNILKTRLHEGRRDFMMGYHPLFYLARCMYGLAESPYLVGGILRFFGYILSCGQRNRSGSTVSKEFKNFIHNEQKKKLLGFIKFF